MYRVFIPTLDRYYNDESVEERWREYHHAPPPTMARSANPMRIMLVVLNPPTSARATAASWAFSSGTVSEAAGAWLAAPSLALSEAVPSGSVTVFSAVCAGAACGAGFGVGAGSGAGAVAAAIVTADIPCKPASVLAPCALLTIELPATAMVAVPDFLALNAIVPNAFFAVKPPPMPAICVSFPAAIDGEAGEIHPLSSVMPVASTRSAGNIASNCTPYAFSATGSTETFTEKA